jgi:hypothetical protein
MRILTRILAALLIGGVLAGCGDGDASDGGDTTATSTTVEAPLRPELRQSASGGIGRIEEWVETWNLVNQALVTQFGEDADFPVLELDSDDFTVRGGQDGFPVFTAQLGEVILGGVVTVEDGGITSLLVAGQPGDPDFLAAYAIWLGSIDPTIDPTALMSTEVAFGDAQSASVESNGRTFTAVKVDAQGGSAIAVTMVAGPSVSDAATTSAHNVVRRNVLGALAAETGD